MELVLRTCVFERKRTDERRKSMGRYLLLWIIGVPLPILLLIALLGGLR